MDALGLTVLERELQADGRVMLAAAEAANRWLDQEQAGFAQAVAYELARFYTVFEKALERVCTAFENHFDKGHDYHDRLLQRMSLEIPGVRPAFVPPAELTGLRDLKGFRHVVRHAYDLHLRTDRLAELAHEARRIAGDFDRWIGIFSKAVREEQRW